MFNCEKIMRSRKSSRSSKIGCKVKKSVPSFLDIYKTDLGSIYEDEIPEMNRLVIRRYVNEKKRNGSLDPMKLFSSIIEKKHAIDDSDCGSEYVNHDSACGSHLSYTNSDSACGSRLSYTNSDSACGSRLSYTNSVYECGSRLSSGLSVSVVPSSKESVFFSDVSSPVYVSPGSGLSDYEIGISPGGSSDDSDDSDDSGFGEEYPEWFKAIGVNFVTTPGGSTRK